MPSFNAGRLERCFVNKLNATVSSSGSHKEFNVFDDNGRLVATTWLSHSWRSTTPISSGMVSKVKRELKMQQYTKEFVGLVECPLSRDQYLALVGDKE
jgi:hypothetical protein